jgi:LemA protein
MSTIIIILLALLGIIVVWFIAGYNGLVRLKALVDEGWSGIDVQLKRRYDLIPNLVATVKQYSIHEKSIIDNIANMRAASMNASGIEAKSAAENGLTQALRSLFAVVENYPDLKANQNFLSLQKDLNAIESDVQLARRYYNGAARNYNIKTDTFPTRIIALITGFLHAPYFEITNDTERENPRVNF